MPTVVDHQASIRRCLDEIERDGFAIVPQVLTPETAARVIADLEAALANSDDAAEAIRNRTGVVYAARNVLSVYPAAGEIWRQPQLVTLLRRVLGERCGLVRVLYFDKPPQRTWSLPWHQDMTIAVADNRLPSDLFTKPTTKAGVPHVEAPAEVLEAMLTMRIHLDNVSDENGPLKVIPGSHRNGKTPTPIDGSIRTIYATQGDVLAIRPLVAHSSGLSHPQSERHRRVLHLEFAAQERLPDGYHWHDFIPA